MLSIRLPAPLLVLLIAVLNGCSSAPATVSGKVTANGKEVTSGGIVFSPIAEEGVLNPGKPGMADLAPNGSYTLKIEPGPGGFQKRYAIRFTAYQLPDTTNDPARQEGKFSVVPYQGMVPKQAEVEIKSGVNVVDIELIKK